MNKENTGQKRRKVKAERECTKNHEISMRKLDSDLSLLWSFKPHSLPIPLGLWISSFSLTQLCWNPQIFYDTPGHGPDMLMLRRTDWTEGSELQMTTSLLHLWDPSPPPTLAWPLNTEWPNTACPSSGWPIPVPRQTHSISCTAQTDRKDHGGLRSQTLMSSQVPSFL